MAKIIFNQKSAVISVSFVRTKRLAFITIFNATVAYNGDENYMEAKKQRATNM